MLKGVGVTSCQDFRQAAAKKTNELPHYFGYVNGYISAYNQITSDTFDVLTWQRTDTLLLMLLTQCEQQPQVSFGIAVSGLVNFMANEKITKKVATAAISGNGNSLVLYEPVLETVLARLESKGYDTSDPYAALLAFRNDEQIPDTKNVHQLILLRLLSASDP